MLQRGGTSVTHANESELRAAAWPNGRVGCSRLPGSADDDEAVNGMMRRGGAVQRA